MNNHPTGTVTFLFTDIEGSTQLWEHHHEWMERAHKTQERILRDAVARHNGYAYKMIGDAFQIAFATARDALDAAIDAQRALLEVGNWKLDVRNAASNFQSLTSNLQLRVRMALHTGVTEERGDDYVGPVLNRVARLMSAGHGGQILISDATESLVRDRLPMNISLRDMGERRLKDLTRAEHVYQIVAADLPSDFPPLKTLDTLPNNLPIQLTSFIGREKEIEEIKRLIAKTRLLTLTGSGGCGKTRLATQVAAEMLDVFKDGVWFIELAPLADPALVPQSIASVFGIRDESGRPIQIAVTDYLRDKNLLLVLDNCEHVIQASAQLADALLHACAKLSILASSREALGVAGETAYRVPSLQIPNPKDQIPTSTLTQYEGVRLFIDRAVAVQKNFQVTNANAPAVAQICHRLDGIPLAIELAASRVKVFSAEEIEARLDDRFRLLTGGSRTALARQQTLRALIDWSYSLLSEPERVLLRRLSVFAGGWTFDAAEEIANPNSQDPKTQVGSWDLGIGILDPLTHLIDKSLVIAEEHNGATRYRMLETIRQYARDKLLESDEGARVRDRHLDFYLKFAEDAEPKLGGEEQLTWFNRLETEHDNLRFALEWSLSEQRIEKGLRIGGALDRFWFARGYWNEAYQRLTDLLKTQGGGRRTLARGKVLRAAGEFTNRIGYFEDSRSLFEESITILRELGAEGRELLELALTRYALALTWRDLASARPYVDEAARLSRESGNRRNLAAALNVLAGNVRRTGDFESARKFFGESVEIYRELGNSSIYTTVLGNLGLLYLDYGDLEKAKEYLEKAVAISRQVGNKQSFASATAGLGNIARLRGQYDEAESLLKQAIAEFRELGDKMFVARQLVSMGRLQLAIGNQLLAEQHLREALSLFKETGARIFIPWSLESFAFLCTALNTPVRAARLFGAAESLREKLGTPLVPIERKEYESYLTSARAQLDESTFNAAWNEGRAMSMEQAVEYAMEEKSQIPKDQIANPNE
ncbi:MAG: tetratricopeptide repeat protein [Chloroflexi bacterium]|nr:tetratricopeptide repeat protein [Chloroflexota bacterium]